MEIRSIITVAPPLEARGSHNRYRQVSWWPMFCLVFAVVVSFSPLVSAALTFTLESPTELHQVPSGNFALWPSWNHDGTRIAFTSTAITGEPLGISEIWVIDLHSGFDATQLVGLAEQPALNDLPGFSPDDNYLLFMTGDFGAETLRISRSSTIVPDTVDQGILVPSDIDPLVEDGVFFAARLADTGIGCKLIVGIRDSDYPLPQGATLVNSIYILSVDISGMPYLSSAVKVLGPVACSSEPGGYLNRLALAPSANEILLVHGPNEKDCDTSLVIGIRAILEGIANPIASMSDPRIVPVENSAYYSDAPAWSEDGSLFFYSEDFNGVFHDVLMNFWDTDFDILVGSLDDVLAGTAVPQRLVQPGNQAIFTASHGGTRLAYVDGLPLLDKVYGCTLRISREIELDAFGICQSDFTLKDGARSELRVAAGTVCGNMETGLQNISVFTPLSPVEEAQIAAGVEGVPVVRHFSPEGATFLPPAELTIAYTDAEVQGLAEAELAVYSYNLATGKFDVELPVLTRDLDGDRITVAVSSFGEGSGGKDGFGTGEIGVAGKTDTDGDGLSDDRENTLGTDPHTRDSDHDGLSDYQEVYWDGNEGLDAYDPTTNPTGTDLNPLSRDTDGDGVSDGTEATFGYNPLDPEETPQLPASSLPALFAVAIIVFVSGCIGLRRWRPIK